jgi:hypothetical protein
MVWRACNTRFLTIIFDDGRDIQLLFRVFSASDEIVSEYAHQAVKSFLRWFSMHLDVLGKNCQDFNAG